MTGLGLWPEVTTGILLAVGVVGIVVPVLPGLLVCLLAVLLWSWTVGGTGAWVVFGLAAAVYVTGVALQYLLPGKRLRDRGIGTLTLALAVIVGVVGFVVVPVVGAPLGFVLTIFLAEMRRSSDRQVAWEQTKHALVAVAHSLGIELLTALAISALWVTAVLIR